MESKPKKSSYKPPPGKKAQIVYYSDKEREALAHIGDGSISEGIRISVRWAAHFWSVGLRPDHNLDHVGISLYVEDGFNEDL